MHGVERIPIGEVSDLIRVGEPLPFRVLDAHARLLLNAGQMLSSQRQLEMLVERGACVERGEADEVRRRLLPEAAFSPQPSARERTLFDVWEHLLWDLDAVLRPLGKGHGAAADILALTDTVLALTERDLDIALFMAVRQEDRRFALYPLAHALHTAVLVLAAAGHLLWLPQRRRSLVGAALTMNASMLELQAHMAEQDTPPTARQLDLIRAHPMRTAELLQAAGITDALWLGTVARHHERADGNGYPQGLKETGDDARLLRIADVYMAKLTPRAVRTPLLPQVASRQLFQQEPGSAVAMALIKAIGVHPPGSLVQLKSGEVAVVTRRGTAGPAPMVCTLSDTHGKPSVNSHMLDTRQPEHAITGPLDDASAYPRVLPERVYGLVPA